MDLPEELKLRLLAESYHYNVSKQIETNLRREAIFHAYLPIDFDTETKILKELKKNEKEQVIYFSAKTLQYRDRSYGISRFDDSVFFHEFGCKFIITHICKDGTAFLGSEESEYDCEMDRAKVLLTPLTIANYYLNLGSSRKTMKLFRIRYYHRKVIELVEKKLISYSLDDAKKLIKEVCLRSFEVNIGKRH